MIATVATIAAITFAAVVLLAALQTAGWCWVVARYKRNRPTYTNLVVSQPPVPPVVFPADVTLADLEKAATAHDFTEMMRRTFPEYREFRESA